MKFIIRYLENIDWYMSQAEQQIQCDKNMIQISCDTIELAPKDKFICNEKETTWYSGKNEIRWIKLFIDI